MEAEHEDLNSSVSILAVVSKHLLRADARLISAEKLHTIVVKQNNDIFALQAMPAYKKN
jgi:hypothetical protein